MHEHLGDYLVELAQRTESSALLAAPFVKSNALQRISEVLAPGVALTVVTRWVPEEIAAGVSDLEVWDIIKRRDGARLRLLPDLHAKYFRFDAASLVGSANITHRALGWAKLPNVELLVEMHCNEFTAFEALLRDRSFEVDDDAYAAMCAAVAALPSHSVQAGPLVTTDDEPGAAASWFPRSLQVQHLFACYENRRDQVIESVYVDGLDDLRALEPPPGLDRDTFSAFVAARLQQVPVVAAIDAAATRALDRTAGAGLLVAVENIPGDEALNAWDTISAWLLHFFPDRYRQKATFTGPALERSQVIK